MQEIIEYLMTKHKMYLEQLTKRNELHDLLQDLYGSVQTIVDQVVTIDDDLVMIDDHEV